jgi:hypothetical protein
MQDFVAEGGLPYRATPFWLSLADEEPEACARNAHGVPVDPILAQTLPSTARPSSPPGLREPLGEAGNNHIRARRAAVRSRILVRARASVSSSAATATGARFCLRAPFPREAASRRFEYLAIHPEVRKCWSRAATPHGLDAQLAESSRRSARFRGQYSSASARARR